MVGAAQVSVTRTTRAYAQSFPRILNACRKSRFQRVVIIARLTTMLGTEELERYARHIVLREVGGPGQAKLKSARVLVVGAGGLGAPVLLYLAAAGVGTLGFVDDDDVSLSNLQRQVIFATEDVGKSKVERAASAVKRLNPYVSTEPHRVRFTAANALDLIARY